LAGNRLVQVKETLFCGHASEDSSANQDKKKEPAAEPANEMAQYNLDDYNKEESKGVSMGAFSNIKGLHYYQNPADDPYVTLDDVSQIPCFPSLKTPSDILQRDYLTEIHA
jgi:hypothetical protein